MVSIKERAAHRSHLGVVPNRWFVITDRTFCTNCSIFTLKN